MGVAVARRGAAPAAAVTTAVACLLGAEVVHSAAMPVHVREWWMAGAFFLVVALLEGATAAVLLLAPSRLLARAAIGLSLATVAVWAWSRTFGVPFGPGAWTPEPVGRADSVATLLELATVLALLPLVRGPGDVVHRSVSARSSRTAAVVAIIGLLTAFGAAGAGHDHDSHSHARPAGQGPPTPINVAGD